ncbi:MAG TPA: hypothetical protein VL282_11400, partial [Tepidisphaeraceae bacterium]|nr:hypothetical protein [Tepidisphaeraceae bacterium]
DSKLELKLTGADDLEFLVREVGTDIFILAAKREGATAKVHFAGLPATDQQGTVLYESPRKIAIQNGGFDDWFAPNDVHVYQIKRHQ